MLLFRIRSTAEPHPTIDPEDYYKHINQELMEFMRMQQLLTWCGHKVLNDPPKALRSTARRKEEADDAAASGIGMFSC